MLVGAVEGAVDGDVPIDVTVSVSIGKHVGQDAVPDAVGAKAAVAFLYRLTGAEVLTRKVTPSDAGTVAVDDALDDPTIVLKWSGYLNGIRR